MISVKKFAKLSSIVLSGIAFTFAFVLKKFLLGDMKTPAELMKK